MINIAVIPARGGSTRLKDKNIHPLNGKPLIYYSIDAVLNSDCFDKVYVSTDSDKIIDVVNQQYKGKVEIYKRDNKYATERITVLEAMIAMMGDIEKKEDITEYSTFSYFLPTCPFVTSEDIYEGKSLFNSCSTYGTDAVISVVEYSEPMQLAMIKKNNDLFPIFDNLTSGLTNSKFIQKYYKPSGAFYMSRWNHLKETKNFFKGNIRGVEISKERYVDIDDINDIKYAEFLLKEGIIKI